LATIRIVFPKIFGFAQLSDHFYLFERCSLIGFIGARGSIRSTQMA